MCHYYLYLPGATKSIKTDPSLQGQGSYFSSAYSPSFPGAGQTAQSPYYPTMQGNVVVVIVFALLLRQ